MTPIVPNKSRDGWSQSATPAARRGRGGGKPVRPNEIWPAITRIGALLLPVIPDGHVGEVVSEVPVIVLDHRLCRPLIRQPAKLR